MIPKCCGDPGDCDRPCDFHKDRNWQKFLEAARLFRWEALTEKWDEQDRLNERWLNQQARFITRAVDGHWPERAFYRSED